jgi:hypothetical protein
MSPEHLGFPLLGMIQACLYSACKERVPNVKCCAKKFNKAREILKQVGKIEEKGEGIAQTFNYSIVYLL